MKASYILAPLAVVAACYGASAVQTDWSGGPGVHGPSGQWGTTFDSCEVSVDYSSISGCLAVSWGVLEDVITMIPESQEYAIRVRAADMDGDGDVDLIASAEVDDRVCWWENVDGLGKSWMVHDVDTAFDGAWDAVAADIDGDDDVDLFGAAKNADLVVWWENTDGSATSWTIHTIAESFDGVKVLAVADMNDDGEVDVIGGAKNGDAISLWLNSGGGSSWQEVSVVTKLDAVNSVVAFDIDKDGDLDILGTATLDKAIRWWENTDGSATSWTSHVVSSTFSGVRTAEAADLDDDGDIDIIAAGGSCKSPANEVAWWENTDGSCDNWEKHVIGSGVDGAHVVLTYDIDDDGDLDVFATAIFAHKILMWENEGSASSWTEHQLCSYNSPRSMVLADIDGNGIMDVAAGSVSREAISWWRVMGYDPCAVLKSTILDTGGDSEWGTLSWNATPVTGTWVNLRVRSSWDQDDLGEWSDTLAVSPVDISKYIDDGDRFFQYMVELRSPGCDTFPVFGEIVLDWTPLGMGSETPMDTFLEVAGGNPSTGSVLLRYGLAEAGISRVSLYDIAGRCLFTEGPAFRAAGSHETWVTGLVPGLYFVRLSCPSGVFSKRFTVLDRM